MPHFKARAIASKELRAVVAKARKHKANQLQAHECLKKIVKCDNVALLITRFDRRNYNVVYFLGYRRKIAFEWLNSVGRASVEHSKRQDASVKWLQEKGLKATVQYFKCIDAYDFCTKRAERAFRTWEKRDGALLFLGKRAAKFKRVWEAKKSALRYLIPRGERAITHLSSQRQCQSFLAERGEVAKEYMIRFTESLGYLLKWGYESSHHVAIQGEARAWLSQKIVRIQKGMKLREEARKELEKRGVHAKRHVMAHAKARGVLANRVEMARQRHERGMKAINDLALFVGDARVTLARRALEIQCPGKIKDTEKAIKQEDKDKDRQRKALSVDARFQVELKDAYDYYDTDGGGEIDKIVFRHLLNSGYLLQIPIEEIDDCYTQIDKDGSGGVDFGEFYSWFNHEWSHDRHRGKKNGFRVANIIPSRQRAIRQLLPKFSKGELQDDFGTMIPPPGKEIILEGMDDRWWLDDISRKAVPFSSYLKKRKELEEKMAEKKAAKERAADEAAAASVKSLTTAQKAEARQSAENQKADKLTEAKKRLEMRKEQAKAES